MRMGLGLNLRWFSAGTFNISPPTITGTRGGTLTAVPGTWSGATVTALWYADGVSTANTTTSFTDTDTTKTLEYRETALPGSLVASAYRGTLATAADFFDDFNAYADGTRLAAQYPASYGSLTLSATATPNIAGWAYKYDSEGAPNGDVNTTGDCQNLRIVSGKIQYSTIVNLGGQMGYVCRDFGATTGIYDFTIIGNIAASSNQNRDIGLSLNFTTFFAAPTGYIVRVNYYGGKVELINASTAALIATVVTSGAALTGADVIRVRYGDSAGNVKLYLNGSQIGTVGGYDVSAAATTVTGIAGFPRVMPNAAAGDNVCDAITYNSLQSNSVVAAINVQPASTPGKKQLDVTANIGMTGATGAQYKVETPGGALVQGWTTMSYAATTGTGTYLLPDFAYEGQQLRVLVRNVGGTVKITSALSPTNGYVLQQAMRVGINDSFWSYYVGQVEGRDWFEQREMFVKGNGVAAGHDAILPKGIAAGSYQNWDQVYSASQLYPAVSATDAYANCFVNGVEWGRTVLTARSGVAPDPTDPNGTVSGWKRTGRALGSVIGISADGWPTQMPADTNLTLEFAMASWYPATGRYPFTIACKTQPGIAMFLNGGSGVTMSSANIAAGTFTLNVTADPISALRIDRATSTATLDSTFFLSGIPSYETGTPALDVGAPYISADKQLDLAPFTSYRNLDGEPINRLAATFKGTFTAANNTTSGTHRKWKYHANLVNALGMRSTVVQMPDDCSNDYIDAMATYYLGALNSTVQVHVELGNEMWNAGFQQWQDLNTAAYALSVADAAYQSPGKLFARRNKAAVQRWKTIWAAAGQGGRCKGVFAWQAAASTATYQTLLDFESQYQAIDIVMTAPYFEGGVGGYNVGQYASAPTAVRAAVTANDQTAFNTAMDTQVTSAIGSSITQAKTLFDFLPGYSVGKGLNKNAISLNAYEGGQHIVTSDGASWDTALGAGMGTRFQNMVIAYKRSANFGVKMGYYLDQLALNCPMLMHLYQYVGTTTYQGWGQLDRTRAITQEPYASIKAKALTYNV